MRGKSPRWESELWSYVCSGDAVHCPLYRHCQVRQRGGWCPGDNVRVIERLFDKNVLTITRNQEGKVVSE